MIRRFNASAHRPYDSITSATGGDPAVHNPYHRIKHGAEEVMARARALASDRRLSQAVRDEATSIILLCQDMPDDIDAVERLVTLQIADMRGMCQEGIAMAQENNAMRRELDARSGEYPAITVPLTREPRDAAAGE